VQRSRSSQLLEAVALATGGAACLVCSCVAGPSSPGSACGGDAFVAAVADEELDRLATMLVRGPCGGEGSLELRNKGEDDLCDFSIMQVVPREHKRALVERCKAIPSLDRAMGAFCGLAVGDALGHPFEFIPATDFPGSSRFDLATKEFHGEFNKFRLQRGQWTDDTAMALCMADSLILRECFDGADMRIRFWCWWFRGYNNSFRFDSDRPSKTSIGLGGNVKKSLDELADGKEATGSVSPIYQSDAEDAGNGSLMRLAPVALFLRAAPVDELHRVARLSSYTTHPGRVAAEACAALAHLVAKALRRPAGSPPDAKRFLEEATQDFLEVSRLAGQSGPGYEELGWLLASCPVRETERCWNWKAESLDIAATLAARGWSYNGYPVTADYFGSYCLDGLAVALWAVYHTTSFDEAVTRAVNFCGDADSFGSMAGQLAGALYGYSAINPQFIEWQSRWDDHELAARALLLHHLGTAS